MSSIDRGPWQGAAIGAAIFLSLLATGPASAQSRDVQQLMDRIDRLERELGTLQRNAYGGRPPPPGAGAPPPGSASGDQSGIARMEVRLSELEGILASITGRLEELTYQNQSLQNRLDKLVSDVDFRLRSLEGGAPPPSGQSAQAAQSPSGGPQQGQAPAQVPGGRTSLVVPGAPPQQGQPQSQAQAAPPPAGQPGILGTLTQSEAANAQRAPLPQAQPQAGRPAQPQQPPQQQAAAPVTLPQGSAKDKYEFAYNLLRQRQYPEAEQAFRQFISQHKADELSGNAYYWLGETHYVRRQFEPAAVAFLEGYNGFPKGSKAVDNLLKLGMSLANLNRQKEACTTFLRLSREFPDAPANMKAIADNERRKLSCPV